MGGDGCDKNTVEKSPYLKCNQCGFVFEGGSSRKSHIKEGVGEIRDSGEKPTFKCNQCECEFGDASMLESHK